MVKKPTTVKKKKQKIKKNQQQEKEAATGDLFNKLVDFWQRTYHLYSYNLDGQVDFII